MPACRSCTCDRPRPSQPSRRPRGWAGSRACSDGRRKRVTDVSGRSATGSRLSPGQLLNGRYAIVETLGIGGMSEAYKARDTQTGQLVVIKVPHLSIIGDPATYSRYQRELEIGKRLNHPHIQHLIAEGRIGNTVAPYLVLEYVDGELLRDKLAAHAPLDPERAIDIAAQLADALEYCHAQGVVHRDLKPENVLITP